jgi:hypothetical protein
MCEVSGELTVILITIWRLQKLGKDLNLRELSEVEVRKQN